MRYIPCLLFMLVTLGMLSISVKWSDGASFTYVGWIDCIIHNIHKNK